MMVIPATADLRRFMGCLQRFRAGVKRSNADSSMFLMPVQRHSAGTVATAAWCVKGIAVYSAAPLPPTARQKATCPNHGRVFHRSQDAAAGTVRRSGVGQDRIMRVASVRLMSLRLKPLRHFGPIPHQGGLEVVIVRHHDPRVCMPYAQRDDVRTNLLGHDVAAD